jgi:hypothetical protein
MALPTVEDISTLDFPSRGLPYVDVPAKTGITTQTMDYVSRGLPFITNDDFDGGAPPVVISITGPFMTVNTGFWGS